MPVMSLLVLELDPQVGGALDLFLRGRGHRVRAAATLAEAIRALAAEAADVVLIGDIPDSTDTASVAQRLRAIAGARPCGIVALASTMDDIAGVDCVLPRGCHPRAILDALRTLAKKRATTGPIPALGA